MELVDTTTKYSFYSFPNYEVLEAQGEHNSLWSNHIMIFFSTVYTKKSTNFPSNNNNLQTQKKKKKERKETMNFFWTNIDSPFFLLY
jgi:hypothetical protein